MEIWKGIAAPKALDFRRDHTVFFLLSLQLLHLPKWRLTYAGGLKITPGVPGFFGRCVNMNLATHVDFCWVLGLIWVRDLHGVSQQKDNCFNGERRALRKSTADIKCYIPLAFSKEEAVFLYLWKSSSKHLMPPSWLPWADQCYASLLETIRVWSIYGDKMSISPLADVIHVKAESYPWSS